MPRIALLLCALITLPSMAQVLQIPVGVQGDSRIAMPQRGERSQAVLTRFGLPDQEYPAVGNPPITRWDYREFSVYFESAVVVNSVLHHRPSTPAQAMQDHAQ